MLYRLPEAGERGGAQAVSPDPFPKGTTAFMRRHRRIGIALLCAALVSAGGPALARQDELVPPVLETFVDAPYPEQAQKDGASGDVVLVLDVDANGNVTNATVKEGVGHGLDEAAIEAAKKFTFKPATKNGKPAAARILYKYTFTLKTPEPPKPTSGTLHGTARVSNGAFGAGRPASGGTSGGEVALEGATITVTAADGTTHTTKTTADGSWEIPELAPGKYKVSVAADGYETFRADEDVTAGQSTDVVYRVRLKSDGVAEVVVRGDPPPREVTKHELSRRELSRVPGTNGDALKAIQALPGVARPPGPTGLLIVRGSAPQDTQIFVDGTPVPIVYHFGGFSSVVPTESIDKLDFYPGNFGVQYGRAMGGVVDVTLRKPEVDDRKYHMMGQVDLIDARVMARGPIGESWTFFVAGRRSWIDAWIGKALDATGAVGTTSAPVYYDVQAFLETRPSASSRFRIGYFGSDDKLELFLKNPSDQDPAISGDVGAHTGFGRIQALYENAFSEKVRVKSVAAWGYDVKRIGAGQLLVDINDKPLTSRTEVSWKPASFLKLNVGEDFEWHHANVNVRAPQPPRPGETSRGPAFTQGFMVQQTTRDTLKPAAYGDVELQPTDSLRFVAGGRLDYSSDTAEWDPSVRLNARYDIHHEFPRTTLKAGWGQFYQPPQPQETDNVFGSPGLKSNRSVHYSVGIEQELTKQIDLSLEGYYKDLSQLVTRIPTDRGTQYTNGGSGYVAGAELLLRYKPDEHFFGWVSYSLSRSMRRDQADQGLTLFQYDQPHILTVLGSYKLGRGWEIGGRFRFVSGNLYTPCQGIGGFYDSSTGTYGCITGTAFGQRLPPFHSLDVRVDKTWDFNVWKLSVYADIYNVYNYQSPDSISYNYNYAQTTYQKGLPIIPSIGIRGEF